VWAVTDFGLQRNGMDGLVIRMTLYQLQKLGLFSEDFTISLYTGSAMKLLTLKLLPLYYIEKMFEMNTAFLNEICISCHETYQLFI